MPFKANASCRHHIPKQRRQLTNWPAYEAGLRQGGDLTVWFSDKAIAAWRAEPRTNRGGQPCYSPLAILTALTLRAVFHLALRQTEGLIGSIIRLLGLNLSVPEALLHGLTGGSRNPQPHLCSSDAVEVRAFQLQHPVQDMNGDADLGRPTLILARSLLPFAPGGNLMRC